MGSTLLALATGLQGNRDQQRFAVSLIVLLFGAGFLGALENPLGGFLFGILVAGSAMPEVQSISQPRERDLSI
jgi:hypothetical protein